MATHMIPRPVTDNDSEADVETNVVTPLLTAPEYLAIPQDQVKSQKYFAQTALGKGAGLRVGYYPDRVVYIDALPAAVLEAKAPDETAAKGYREAAQYAHDINTRFAADVDPCTVVLATNGIDFLAGFWNAQPLISCKVADLVVGSQRLQDLLDLASFKKLSANIAEIAPKLNTGAFRSAFHRNGGQAMIMGKVEANTFASDISPILRRYFSSHNDTTDPVIYDESYISSDEVTKYDRALESFLKDRVARRRQVPLVTSKSDEQNLTKKLEEAAVERPINGTLQLITGGVGSGKSLFARRYKEKLQPADLAIRTHWAFIDFNTGKAKIEDRETWVCEEFAKGIVAEGAPINLKNADDQERIFSTNINDRRPYYDRVDRRKPGEGGLELARDIEAWRLDPQKLAVGIARYLQGDRGENIVVVFDNVDRLEVSDQLSIFQTALWFMTQTRTFVLLQMRDVTFEAYQNVPPLDTYRSGTIFHISPPKFIDVARKRLELSVEELNLTANETIRYNLPNGAQIAYPKTRAGEFLRAIYDEVFASSRNVARVIESLAGRDVREALNMFMAVLTSGHMPEDLMTATAQNLPDAGLTEARIIRILMRTDYKFFDGKNGFIKNIFHADNNWGRPTNFLIGEILYLLLMRSRTVGDNGQMGFVTVSRAQDELEKMGYLREDAYDACSYALSKRLIEADTQSLTRLGLEDSVKATASGWSHMRHLAERVEYLSGVLPVTAVSDEDLRNEIFRHMEIEVRYKDLYQNQRLSLADYFLTYLRAQYDKLQAYPGYAQTKDCGAAYLLSKMERAIKFARNPSQRPAAWVDPLDF